MAAGRALHGHRLSPIVGHLRDADTKRRLGDGRAYRLGAMESSQAPGPVPIRRPAFSSRVSVESYLRAAVLPRSGSTGLTASPRSPVARIARSSGAAGEPQPAAGTSTTSTS